MQKKRIIIERKDVLGRTGGEYVILPPDDEGMCRVIQRESYSANHEFKESVKSAAKRINALVSLGANVLRGNVTPWLNEKAPTAS